MPQDLHNPNRPLQEYDAIVLLFVETYVSLPRFACHRHNHDVIHLGFAGAKAMQGTRRKPEASLPTNGDVPVAFGAASQSIEFAAQPVPQPLPPVSDEMPDCE